MATSLHTRTDPRHNHREWSALISDPPFYPADSRRTRRSQHWVSCQCGTVPRCLWLDARNPRFKIRLDRDVGHRVAHASAACLDLYPASESELLVDFAFL